MKKWMARDKDGFLFIGDTKPVLCRGGAGYTWEGRVDYLSSSFPEITFENSPKMIEVKIIEELEEK